MVDPNLVVMLAVGTLLLLNGLIPSVFRRAEGAGDEAHEAPRTDP